MYFTDCEDPVQCFTAWVDPDLLRSHFILSVGLPIMAVLNNYVEKVEVVHPIVLLQEVSLDVGQLGVADAGIESLLISFLRTEQLAFEHFAVVVDPFRL